MQAAQRVASSIPFRHVFLVQFLESAARELIQFLIVPVAFSEHLKVFEISPLHPVLIVVKRFNHFVLLNACHEDCRSHDCSTHESIDSPQCVLNVRPRNILISREIHRVHPCEPVCERE